MANVEKGRLGPADDLGYDEAVGVLRRRPPPPVKGRGEMTLHQLRIFWAVAHAETLTKASKQLGLTQPSLSQQLSKLETTVGARLFDRTPNQMALTDAGRFLLRKAEFILSNIDEAEEGLRGFTEGVRANIRVAGISSVLRVVLPPAVKQLTQTFPDIELDVHETAPADALELLYGRRVNIALVASASLARASIGFHQVSFAEDPYVFAVPEGIDLSSVTDPDGDLSPADQKIINSCIQFTFGTQHTRRVAQWYSQVLPRHRLIAQCRSFEVALGMVQARLGVCLVPALTAFTGNAQLEGVTLYQTTEGTRRLVALMPSQYQRVEPYRSFVQTLQDVGARMQMPTVHETPPFLHRASIESDDANNGGV
jgi:DNA-binding transcriptional LysR family regulator